MWRPVEDTGSPRAGVTGVMIHGCWEMNSGRATIPLDY